MFVVFPSARLFSRRRHYSLCCGYAVEMKRARSSRYQLRQRSARAIPAKSPESSSNESISGDSIDNDEPFKPDENSSEEDDIADDAIEETDVMHETAEEPELSDDEPPKRRRKAIKRRTENTTVLDGKDEIVWTKDGTEKTSSIKISPDAVCSIQSKLSRWYYRNARELPWRVRPRDPDAPPSTAEEQLSPSTESSPGAPYAVWISEVMSQQTRIEVVARYWKRWMAALPTIKALANATPERVRELWAGLGYYRRAQNLHIAAQEIMSNHNGRIPRTSKSLMSLRGVGPYTAGAVASIAFGERSAAIDGNVARVLARLRPSISELTGKKLASAQETAVKQLLNPPIHPADMNQALMELGATVCLPRGGAKCDECVLYNDCGAVAVAQQLGVEPCVIAAELPKPAARKKVKVRSECVAACVVCTKIDDQWQFLVTQRDNDGGLLAGLWETPSRIVNKDVAGNDSTFVSILSQFLHVERDGVNELRKARSVTHIFSHIKQQLEVRVVVLENIHEPKHKSCKWVTSEELVRIALSTQMLKVFKSAGDVIGQKIVRKI